MDYHVERALAGWGSRKGVLRGCRCKVVDLEPKVQVGWNEQPSGFSRQGERAHRLFRISIPWSLNRDKASVKLLAYIAEDAGPV